MSLYTIDGAQLVPVRPTTFTQEAVLERQHLQAMLRSNAAPLGDDLLVLCEEYSNWQDSARRIDLLCLDKARNLVVVEIKRTEDGGHMELQSIRYAAMVSSLTLDQAIIAHAQAIGGNDAEGSARSAVLDFLELDSVEDAELTGEVRIILASADFSPEVTTAVLWLNRKGLDIRCIRMKPYKLGAQLLIDVTQIIPLPEAEDYEVKIREREEQERRVVTSQRQLCRRFWSQFIARSALHNDLFRGRSPSYEGWMGTPLGRGCSLNVVVKEDGARVECYIWAGRNSRERNKALFLALFAQQAEIDAAVGVPLDWQELPTKSACRISWQCPEAGGWRSPEADWPAVHDWLAVQAQRLSVALKDRIQSVTVN